VGEEIAVVGGQFEGGREVGFASGLVLCCPSLRVKKTLAPRMHLGHLTYHD
jgi:hypothetical protein